MLPSQIKDTQRMKQPGSTPVQRHHTRAFAKLHGLSIPNLTLEDLDTATGKGHSRQGSIVPSRPNSQLVPPSNVKQATKNASQQHDRSNLTQIRTKDTQIRPLAETRELRSKRRQLPKEHQGEVQAQSKQLPARLTPPRPEFEEQIDTGRRDTVSAWLGFVDPSPAPAPQDSTAKHVFSRGASPSNPQDMASSSSINTSTSAATEEVASTKASTAKLVTFMEHLEFRGIRDESSSDGKLQELELDKILRNTPSQVEFRKFDSLMKVLENYLRKFRKSIKDQALENGLPVYDALKHEIGDWRPVGDVYRRFPPMSPEHFGWDRRQCSNSSEADFHRTIMMSIIDRYDFHNLFAFSCEELWSIRPEFLIKPTRTKSKITQPKPDLAISFNRSALNDSAFLDYPLELGKCLHPGNKGRERWFPFMFMEAKRDDNSLRDAFEKNLHSASQALFNIFQWMRLFSELEEQFFKDVRVFTIVLNNEDMLLRMHRAEKSSEDRLRYEFTEVVKISDYDRFEACHLIKSVLVDYALPHLHPILKETFKRVAEMDHMSETGKKRKQDAINAQTVAESINPNTMPEETNTPRLQSVNTGLSFDTDNMAVSGPGDAPERSKRRARVD